jgi:hypothetical protein
MNCALCGRPLLNPTVMIGREAIGPKCARKAGLTRLAAQTGSRVLRFSRPKASRADAGRNLDLFEDCPGEGQLEV